MNLPIRRLIILFALPFALCPQSARTPSDRLLRAYGIGNFSEHYRQAVDAYFDAETAYRKGNYVQASKVLDAFWRQHPAGSREWAMGYDEAVSVAQSTGANFGAPVCYYALRMLTDCVAWKTKPRSVPPHAWPVRLTVLLVGRSHGIQPRTQLELHANTGQQVSHGVNPLLAADHAAVVHQSLWLFEEYIHAITAGRLRVETTVVTLPHVDVPMHVRGTPELTAELSDGSLDLIWRAVGSDVKAATDWWCIFYPAHAPEPSPEFPRMDFGGGGGMGLGPDGRSPLFLIDDLWLVRKPPHLGKGPYTEEERRAYLPQWFQHEFFHHLYRSYPEYGLEKITDHQWFERRNWPKDFEGILEPDYYAESLHKRLQPLARPPLHVKLLYALPSGAVLAKLAPQVLTGDYRRDPVENPWHEGSITAGPLQWANHAGVSWHLTLDADGRLVTGTDNPYYDQNPATGREFQLVLRRDTKGRYISQVDGFWFNGEFYKRVR